MIVSRDIYLSDFEFWGPAAEKFSCLYPGEIRQIELVLIDAYPDGIDETELNDLFSYDFDTVASWVFETEESILERE